MRVPRKVLIIGATSAIAQATARLLAAHGAEFVLWARNEEKLRSVVQDLNARFESKISTACFEFSDYEAQRAFLQRAIESLGRIDLALIAHGALPPQQNCENSVAELEQVIEDNFTSAASIATLLAEYFEKEKRGTLAAITSVAGDRGRSGNYVYGSAKSGLSTFLSLSPKT